MKRQQQTVVTSAVQPVYICQPGYQTTSLLSSYRHRQFNVIGALLIIAGCLSIIFNVVDIAVGENGTGYYYPYSYYSYGYASDLSFCSNGMSGHGIWCGIMVSIMLLFSIGDLAAIKMLWIRYKREGN